MSRVRTRARRAGVPLAPYTTFKVGGPADLLVERARPRRSCRQRSALARAAGVPVTVLGGGTNVLVADEGVRGLVVRLRGGTITPLDGRRVADAGVTLNSLVRWTIGRGLAGLEACAGTPGTVGGAIYGNAHGAGRWIGDLVERVSVVTPDGTVTELPQAAMEFAYDQSRLQTSRRGAAAGRCLPSRRGPMWPLFELPRARRWRAGSARSRSTCRARGASFRTRIPLASRCRPGFRRRLAP